jgi:DNA primase
LFESLSKGLDLKHIDGKTELVRLARPLISKLPPGIFQQLIWEKLAEIVQIKIENLQETKEIARPTHKRIENRKLTNQQKSRKSMSVVSPAIKALALLLENPALLSYTDSEQSFESADTPGNTLLCAIIRILRITRQWSIEGIFERLPVELVQELRAVDFKAVAAGVPVGGVEAEYLGSLQRLKERVKEQVMEALLMKAKEHSLSQQQKNELNILLKNRRDHSEYSPDS